jgi:uncharacterized protein (TIGR00299 family) protein
MILYFDPFSGVSGDMIIGALLDLGLDLTHLREELKKIALHGYEIRARKVVRAGVSGTKFDVAVTEHQHGRRYSVIKDLIEQSHLSNWVKEKAVAIFTRIGKIEAGIHNTSIEEIHFHEIGAVDSIVDTVGALIGFEKLGVREFLSGPINVGYGTVQTEHGTLPVPAPATAELLKGIPTYAGPIEGELTTPTGAAILSELVTQYSTQPLMSVEKIGYGAGTRELPRFPNTLRILVGMRPSEHDMEDQGHGDVTVIEANIDDMNPQFYGYFFDKILQAGALDAYLTPIQMKKNRPGTLLTVVCPTPLLSKVTELIFLETTTIGVRYHRMQRQTMSRAITTVRTEYGEVRIKVSRLGDTVLNFAPEFEDCRRLAEQHGLPLKAVHALAVKKFLEQGE